MMLCDTKAILLEREANIAYTRRKLPKNNKLSTMRPQELQLFFCLPRHEIKVCGKKQKQKKFSFALLRNKSFRLLQVPQAYPFVIIMGGERDKRIKDVDVSELIVHFLDKKFIYFLCNIMKPMQFDSIFTRNFLLLFCWDEFLM